jgi:hypothetical protein
VGEMVITYTYLIAPCKMAGTLFGFSPTPILGSPV